MSACFLFWHQWGPWRAEGAFTYVRTCERCRKTQITIRARS